MFTKSICLESAVDSLQFDVIWADTSRVYMYIVIDGQNSKYGEKGRKMPYKGELKEYLKILLKYIKNSTKMFVLLKSIDLYSFQRDPAKKVRWADLWSYWPPSFQKKIRSGILYFLRYCPNNVLNQWFSYNFNHWCNN